MSFSEKVFRAGFINILQNVVNMLIGLGLTPFVVHSLGDVQNGYWVIARLIFGYYGFVDFGVGLSIARFLSFSVGKKDAEESKKIIQTGMNFILCVDAILLVLCLIAYAGIGFLTLSCDVGLARSLLLIMGLSILVILPGRIFAGVLTAHIRQDMIAWIGILNSVIRAIFVVLFLSAGFGVRTLAVISGVIALFTSVSYFLVACRLMPGVKLWKPSFDQRVFSSLFKYGVSISLASVSDLVRWGAATLIAGSLLGAAFVTHFNIALTLGRFGVSLIASSFAVMMPVFGQLIGTGDDERLKTAFFRTLGLTILISVYLFGGLIVLGHDFIGNWMGTDYQDAYPALVLISCGLMVALMQNPVVTLMQGMGLAKLYAITNGIEAILNVVLCFLLGKYGMIGFGLAFSVPMILIKLFVQPAVILSQVGWSLGAFYKKTILRLAGCLIAGVIAALVVFYISGFDGWLSFLIKGVAYSIVYGALTVFVVIGKEERQDLTARLMPFVAIFGR